MASVMVLTLAACGASNAGPQDNSPKTTTSAEAISTRNRTAERDEQVTSLRITTDDPTFGRLTFDALAAGDPGLASKGRLVLLLHGFPASAESYRHVLPILAEGGYYAVAVTQRGYSADARPEPVEAYTMPTLLGDTTRIVHALGAERVHLVGHDWGGGLAWFVAVARPDLVASLTALSTPHPDPFSDAIADPTSPQYAASAYMEALREIDESKVTGGLASVTGRFGPDVEPIPPALASTYADGLSSPEALRGALNWYRANVLPMSGRMGPVRVPTLYLWGSDDFAFLRGPARASEHYVDAPYTFVELDQLGHWLPEEAPETVAAAILRHLDRVPAQTEGAPGAEQTTTSTP